MARLRMSLAGLATVGCVVLAVTQPAAATDSAAAAAETAQSGTQLGPATNWTPDPGAHRGQLTAAPTALPHRAPAATSKALATPAAPQATTSATYSAPSTPQRMIP